MSKKKLTPKKLGQILFEEFRADSWGTFDPDAFRELPKSTDEEHEYSGLYEVIERACKRINEL